MIDMNDVTNFARGRLELLEWWLCCLFVAGKRAFIQAEKLQRFLDLVGLDRLAAGAVPPSELAAALRTVRSGRYRVLHLAIAATQVRLAAEPDWLRLARLAELEAIPGCGPKTARFFVLHSRAGSQVAVLDTHVLRFLREDLGLAGVPRATPASARRYAELEGRFLAWCAGQDQSPARLDLLTWRRMRARRRIDGFASDPDASTPAPGAPILG